MFSYCLETSIAPSFGFSSSFDEVKSVNLRPVYTPGSPAPSTNHSTEQQNVIKCCSAAVGAIGEA